MQYALATYTYNDAFLVDGLLRSVAEWTLQPGSIIVVDDGSEKTYAPPVGVDGVTVLRNDRNRGTTFTKSRGIEAAQAPYVLSLDCDIRLTPDWAALCEKQMEATGATLVSSPLRQQETADFASQYWKIYGDAHNIGAAETVEFLTGGAWLLRKEAWDSVKGFAGHNGRIHEDHFFCRKLREHGYVLAVEPGALATQVRQLSRRAIARKTWTWFEAQVKQHIAGGASLWEVAAAFFTPQAYERITRHIEQQRFVFIYMEILYVVNAVHDLAAWAAASGRAPQSVVRALPYIVDATLRPHPTMLALLREDLPELWAQERGQKAPDGEDAPFFRDMLAPLEKGGVLRLADRELRACQLAHGKIAYDFSMYEYGSPE